MKIEKPQRVNRTYTQKINGKPSDVFSLLCPVREAEWIEGWNPEIVYANSGTAEQDCIFITYIAGKKTIWIINRYEPENYYVEMIRTTADNIIVKLTIKLYENAGQTDAYITYTYTAISEEGIKELPGFTQEYFDSFMKEWENNMNYYLKTGNIRQK